MSTTREQAWRELQAFVCPDIGTSNSSVSSTEATSRGLDTNGRKPMITAHTKYLIHPVQQDANPTTDMLFVPGRDTPLTGFTLSMNPRYMRCRYEASQLFRYVKLLAHEPKSGDARQIFDQLIKQAEQRGKTRGELLEVFANNFYDETLPTLRDTNGWKEGIKTHLAITVPAGWTPAEHALMLNYFKRKGRQHGVSNFLLVTEPHAQLLWHAHEKENRGDLYKSGDIVMVVDVGGGTTCISLFEIISPDGSKIRPIGGSISISNGMQVLSTQFGEMVRQRLQNVVLPPNFDIEDAVQWAIMQFEDKKVGFGPSTLGSIEIYLDGLQRNEEMSFRDNNMIIDYQEIKALFDHSFKYTLSAMKSTMLHKRAVNEIYFCGGGARNNYLWSKLEKAFDYDVKHHNIHLARQEKDFQVAVSNGGTLAALNAFMGQDVTKKMVAAKRQSVLIYVELDSDSEIRNHYSGQHLEFNPLGSAFGSGDHIFMLEHLITKDESVHTKHKHSVDGFRDIKIGELRYRQFEWEDLKIGEGGKKIEDILFIMDQLPETLGQDFNGRSAVNAIINDGGTAIVGFKDLSGNFLTGVEISHELFWNLDFSRTHYQKYHRDEGSTGLVRVSYRYILQANEMGETRYMARVAWQARPARKKGQLEQPSLRTVLRDFPATARPIKGGHIDIVRMTRTCDATYALPHQDKDTEGSLLLPEPPASPLANSWLPIHNQHLNISEELTISPLNFSPLSLQPDLLLESSSSSSSKPTSTPLSSTLSARSPSSSGEEEYREEHRNKRQKISAAGNSSPTPVDESIPARQPSLRAFHLRGPWDKDKPGLRQSMKRRCREKQSRGRSNP